LRKGEGSGGQEGNDELKAETHFDGVKNVWVVECLA
jgi:hypothetical protein